MANEGSGDEERAREGAAVTLEDSTSAATTPSGDAANAVQQELQPQQQQEPQEQQQQEPQEQQQQQLQEEEQLPEQQEAQEEDQRAEQQPATDPIPEEAKEEGEELEEGVRKVVMKKGRDAEGKPKKGATVFANYRAWVASSGAKVHDTWDEDNALEVNIGNERAQLRGLCIGLQSMNPGERSILKVPHGLAYGEEGSFSFPHVPPRSDLIYEVLMTGFDQPAEGRARANMTVEERIEAAAKRKEKGNEHFREDHVEDALQEYEMALGYMGEEFMMQMFGKYHEMSNAVWMPCMLNSAACLLKLEKYTEAIGLCNKVLVEDKENVKALFRRGKARLALGQLDVAKEDLQRALKLAPKDAGIVRALAQIKAEEKEQLEKQKKLYKGILKPAQGSSSGESSSSGKAGVNSRGGNKSNGSKGKAVSWGESQEDGEKDGEKDEGTDGEKGAVAPLLSRLWGVVSAMLRWWWNLLWRPKRD